MEHLNSNLDELLEVKCIINDVEKGITETKKNLYWKTRTDEI